MATADAAPGLAPLGFDAGDANLYRYVRNRPDHATDPTGQEIVVENNAEVIESVLGPLSGAGLGVQRASLPGSRVLIDIRGNTPAALDAAARKGYLLRRAVAAGRSDTSHIGLSSRQTNFAESLTREEKAFIDGYRGKDSIDKSYNPEMILVYFDGMVSAAGGYDRPGARVARVYLKELLDAANAVTRDEMKATGIESQSPCEQYVAAFRTRAGDIRQRLIKEQQAILNKPIDDDGALTGAEKARKKLEAIKGHLTEVRDWFTFSEERYPSNLLPTATHIVVRFSLRNGATFFIDDGNSGNEHHIFSFRDFRANYRPGLYERPINRAVYEITRPLNGSLIGPIP